MKKSLALLMVLIFCLAAKSQDLSKVTLNTVWYQADSVFEQIYPVTTTGSEMKGAFKKKMKIVYNGATSNVKVKDIILYVYANPTYLQSPANFAIIPLVSEDDKRTYQWMSASMVKAKTNEGTIPVDYVKVADNVFRVTPKSKLASGEYGFTLSTAGMPATIFGFTITCK